MSLTKFIKDLLRKPEAIPTPGAIIYGVTVTRVLRKPEIKIANDIVEKVKGGTILDLGSGLRHRPQQTNGQDCRAPCPRRR
jgi:hypothetical protein